MRCGWRSSLWVCLALAGCGQSFVHFPDDMTTGSPPDMAIGFDFTTVPADFAGRDMTGVPLDMTARDMTGVSVDMTARDMTTSLEDMTGPADMTAVADMTMPLDMTVPPDLIPPPDLIQPPDLVPPPDLTQPPDMVSTCSDGTQNGGETGVDCGGPCPTKCGVGVGCAMTGDCQPFLACQAMICTALPSCRALQMAGLANTDGVYPLDPCGTGVGNYFCDMTRRGGGWTVAGVQNADAKTNMGITNSGTVGVAPWSKNLACVPYTDVMIFNNDPALVLAMTDSFTQVYPMSIWMFSMTNLTQGSGPFAFHQGVYGDASSLIMMGCVDGPGDNPFACDNDNGGGAKGHVSDYAGEYCVGGRLDGTWAWTDGLVCLLRGVPYTWGIAVR
jgi:hypothetical protein